MTRASRPSGIGHLFAVGAATLFAVARALRSSQRSVEAAGYRAEYLREEQGRLLEILREERRTFQREIEREREGFLQEIRRRNEQLSRELSLARQERERLAEELQRERHLRLETQQRMDQLEKDLRELRGAREKETPALVPAGLLEEEDLVGDVAATVAPPRPPAPEPLASKPAAPRPAAPKPSTPRPTAPKPAAPRPPVLETARPAARAERPASKPAKAPPEDKKPSRRAVWHPHPDDVAGKEKTPTGADSRSEAPVEMFRRHYDRYLENYEGYVELAETLYRTRDAGEVASGFGERQWEERLRRARDGMERTTARLDILEQHNPELATDDRISHRAGIARRHARL